MQTIDRSLMTFLVNAIWQAPLIAVAVAVACRWMRHAPARHIHLICVVGLFASLLLPAISTRRTAPETERLAVPQQELTTPAPATAPAPIAATPRTVQLPQTAVSFAIWAFAGFLLFRVVLLAVAARKTLRICRDSEPAPSCPAFDRARAAFSLDDVELRWSATVTGPVTAGRLIILPTAMVDASDDVLTTAIGHEMAHIARHDFAWNIAYEILSLPISFQPAAFWLRRQLDRTRELACDELVATRLLDSRAYAQSIMEIASSMCAVSRPGYTLGVFDGDILEERIKRLVQRPAAYTRRARVLAVAGIAGLAICLVAASSLAISARAQGPAQQNLRTGAAAYNTGDFPAAVASFERAVAAEPDNIKARLFLVDAYMQLDSKAANEKARAQALEALRRDPKNLPATLAVVSLNGPARAAESHQLLLKAIELNPKSAEAYYTLGFVDWTIAYPRLQQVSPYRGARSYDLIPDMAKRIALRQELQPTLEEGYRVLLIANQLDPTWPDPMAYLNLLYRINAALVDDSAQSAALIAKADDWVEKALAAKKARSTSQNARPHLDPDGAPPATTSMLFVPTPPPPPPPPPGAIPGERRK
jgi:beta-lactamase regulating signal transducer with metallopeptidase domain